MFKYPVYKPCLTGKEKEYLNECIDTGWISSKGRFVKDFEESFARFNNNRHAIAVSNGTVALHVALLALGIGQGDEVIVPTLTYIASVNAIKYTGATPVFVDSEKDYWQVDIEDIKRKMTPKTKAVMVVHLYGHPCNMDEICKIAEENNLYIIEDCAEALGAEYKGKKVGSFGNISTYSFFGNKTITTGEGGMVATNDESLKMLVTRLRGQGLAEGREYWHDIIGYNYRLTNISCAIGLAQLENAENILNKKQQIAHWYKENLKGLPVELQGESPDIKHSYWMCSILTDQKKDRDELREYLKQNKIETRPLFYPIHQMPMYNTKETFEVAENLAARGINLPSYPELMKEDIMFITDKIRTFYE